MSDLATKRSCSDNPESENMRDEELFGWTRDDDAHPATAEDSSASGDSLCGVCQDSTKLASSASKFGGRTEQPCLHPDHAAPKSSTSQANLAASIPTILGEVSKEPQDIIANPEKLLPIEKALMESAQKRAKSSSKGSSPSASSSETGPFSASKFTHKNRSYMVLESPSACLCRVSGTMIQSTLIVK